MIISSVNIRIDNSDGTYTEFRTIMPKEVAEQTLSDVLDWKHNYIATVRELEQYQTAVDDWKGAPVPLDIEEGENKYNNLFDE